MRVRRALLYMPGTDWRKIEKSTGLGVDSVCMDLEDGIVLSRKEEGRATVVKALKTLDFGNTEKLVRINEIGSGLELADLEAVVPAGPDGIVIPKVASADQIRWVNEQLSRLEKDIPGLQKPIHILAVVETAMGIVMLSEIAQADERLQALIFGAEDLAGDIGAVRTTEAKEVFYARSAVVTYAAAFGLQAIDMVASNFKDIEAAVQSSRQGIELGYQGRQIIHPNQVEPIQAAFTPSDEEIMAAKDILMAFSEHQESGVGAFEINGKMVDMPNLRAAETVLAKAKVAGKDI